MLGESTALLAQLTAGLSSGQLLEVVRQLAARLRPPPGPDGPTTTNPPVSGQAGQGTVPHGRRRVAHPTAAAISDAALELLPAFAPLSKQEAQEIREWTGQVHQPLPPEVWCIWLGLVACTSSTAIQARRSACLPGSSPAPAAPKGSSQHKEVRPMERWQQPAAALSVGAWRSDALAYNGAPLPGVVSAKRWCHGAQ